MPRSLPRRTLVGQPRWPSLLLVGLSFAGSWLASGCEDQEASASRAAIATKHAKRVRAIVREDRARIRAGLRIAAERLAPGFFVEGTGARERQIRAALRRVQDMEASPRVRIAQLAISPLTFLAAVGPDGRVIARDAEPDRMKGEPFAERFEAVAAALRGEPSEALVTFESRGRDGSRGSHHSWLFTQPVRGEGGAVVGALVAGVPLWREAQRLSRQIRLEHATEIGKGLVLWVYLFVGDRLYHFGTPPELDEHVPDAPERAEGLARSPAGFDGALNVLHRVYGYGVYPLPELAEGVGMVLLRAEPRAR